MPNQDGRKAKLISIKREFHTDNVNSPPEVRLETMTRQ